jgi:hypothetical protein
MDSRLIDKTNIGLMKQIFLGSKKEKTKLKYCSSEV